jgi:hypothetical protein
MIRALRIGAIRRRLLRCIGISPHRFNQGLQPDRLEQDVVKPRRPLVFDAAVDNACRRDNGNITQAIIGLEGTNHALTRQIRQAAIKQNHTGPVLTRQIDNRASACRIDNLHAFPDKNHPIKITRCRIVLSDEHKRPGVCRYFSHSDNSHCDHTPPMARGETL